MSRPLDGTAFIEHLVRLGLVPEGLDLTEAHVHARIDAPLELEITYIPAGDAEKLDEGTEEPPREILYHERKR